MMISEADEEFIYESEWKWFPIEVNEWNCFLILWYRTEKMKSRLYRTV